MAVRALVRGQVPWPQLEAVMAELAERHGRETVHVRFLEADNWLSTPCVVDEEFFVKVVSPQNAFVHALFTTGRNIGAFSSGTEGFFDRFDTPLEMVEHELAATAEMRSLGVNAPEPVETFPVEDHGVLVVEYLPEFRSLDEVDVETVRALAPDLFATLATLHENGLAHGDLRAENVLVLSGELYFIDATKVTAAGLEDARGYDIACGLAVLEPLVGAAAAVAAAVAAYDGTTVLSASDFLDFVNMRPDHDFDANRVRGEIEKAVA